MKSAIDVRSNFLSFEVMMRLSIAIESLLIILSRGKNERWIMSEIIILNIALLFIIMDWQVPSVLL